MSGTSIISLRYGAGIDAVLLRNKGGGYVCDANNAHILTF